MPVIDPRQCWRTPPDLWAKMNNLWFFDVDAAADSKSKLCTKWFGPDHPDEHMRDGLSAQWCDAIDYEYSAYCNPGFSEIARWLEKAWIEVHDDHCELAVVMSHVQTSTDWWREWAMRADEILFLSPRVNFVPADPAVKPTSNARDNCLIVYRTGPIIEGSTPRMRTWRWK